MTVRRRFVPILVATIALLPSAPSKAQSATVGPPHGALVIVGGGSIGKEIWERFVALAGGKQARIVVVPTASEEPEAGAAEVKALREAGAANVEILHTADPKVADTDRFVEPLKSATGVWFGGGRQWRLADAYLGTKTQRAFESVLERGGAIGGSSAGATIQGSYLVRGDTQGNAKVVGDHTVGFAYLKNAAIDQHVLRRNRPFDLIPLIASRPELLGIGIDERTAIVVQENRFDVVGPSYVLIYNAMEWGDPDKKGRFTILSPGDRYDLKTRKLLKK